MVNIHDEIRSGRIPIQVESFRDDDGDRVRRIQSSDDWEIQACGQSSWRTFGGESIEDWCAFPVTVTGLRRKTISMPEVPGGMDLIGRTGTRYVRVSPSSRWWMYGDDETRISLAHILFDDGPLEVVPALPPASTLEDDIALVRGCLPRPGPTYDAFQRMVARLKGES